MLATIPTGLTGVSLYHRFVTGREDDARGYAFYALTAWLAIPTGAAICLTAPVAMAMGDEHRQMLNQLVLWWARATTYPFFVPTIEGIEHMLPDGQPALVVANHQSFMDIYSLWWVDAPLRFVAKASIKYIVIAGWLLETCGHVSVNRRSKESIEAAMESCREKLVLGGKIVFFAEGTRGPPLGKFKLGAFRLAVEQGVPIVPVTINGTGAMNPKGNEFKLFPVGAGQPSITIHPAIHVEGKTAEELMHLTRAVVASALPPSER